MTIITIKINVPDAKATEVLEKATAYLGYQAMIPDENGIMNPITRKQWLDRAIREYIKSCYRSQLAIDADSYRVTAITTADAVEIKEV